MASRGLREEEEEACVCDDRQRDCIRFIIQLPVSNCGYYDWQVLGVFSSRRLLQLNVGGGREFVTSVKERMRRSRLFALPFP